MLAAGGVLGHFVESGDAGAQVGQQRVSATAPVPGHVRVIVAGGTAYIAGSDTGVQVDVAGLTRSAAGKAGTRWVSIPAPNALYGSDALATRYISDTQARQESTLPLCACCERRSSMPRERECGSIGAMSDPRTAPYGAVRLADVDTLAQVDPGNEENQTNGHQELYAVMTGHAVFTVDGEEIDAPAGTIVFVRDPALLRAARATADSTAIFMVGAPAGVPYTVSRWEASLP